MTKKDLEDKVKALRAKLDEQQIELDDLRAARKELGELGESAVGGFYDHLKREWVLTELSFNADTGEAKVIKSKSVGPDVAMFQYYVNQFVADEIHLKNLRRG